MEHHCELIDLQSSTTKWRDATQQGRKKMVNWDSCGIFAIGGMAYMPKSLTPESHMRMGAITPFRTGANNMRGFPFTAYRQGSEFPPSLLFDDPTSPAAAALFEELEDLQKNQQAHMQSRKVFNEKLHSSKKK